MLLPIKDVCPECSGCGRIYENGLETDDQYEFCMYCGGMGWVDQEDEE